MKPFLTAEWRYLLMLNYAVDPALLQPLVPAGTVLDRWGGSCWASLVGFRFLGARVRGLAVPGQRDFDEVNLRFYVRRELADGGIRRGVVFVREFVPRRAIAWVARLAYHEPYRAVPMRSQAPALPSQAPGRLRYAWRSGGRWHSLAATAAGDAGRPAADSAAAFITEHYWGYTRRRDGRTAEYQVTHPPWRVWAGADPAVEADLAACYGPAWAVALAGPPSSAHIAEGSPVTVLPAGVLPGSSIGQA